MANIMILYNDGSIISKKEENITKDDIKSSKYLLIDTNTTENGDHRNFIMVQSSKYIFFTRAVIEYQIMMVYTEYDNEVDYAPITPIRTEVTKYSELICMINTIDKVNVTNNLFGNFTVNDDCIYIGFCFVGVRIFDGTNEVYNEVFEITGTSTRPYESCNVTKKFKRIYPHLLMNELSVDKINLYLYSSGKRLYWEFGDKDLDSYYEYIGIPMLDSNTITFCLKSEYDQLVKYKKMNFSFFIYFETMDKISTISEMIVNGESNDVISEYILNMNDIYIDTHDIVFSIGHRLSKVLDVLVHLKFIFESSNMIFESVYPDDIGESINGSHSEFDSVIFINMGTRDRGISKKEIEFSMNISSLICLTDILRNL